MNENLKEFLYLFLACIIAIFICYYTDESFSKFFNKYSIPNRIFIAIGYSIICSIIMMIIRRIFKFLIGIIP